MSRMAASVAERSVVIPSRRIRCIGADDGPTHS